jgi:hypothetical protein
MRERIDWSPQDSVPGRAEVLELQGVPRDVPLPARIATLHEAALSAYLETAEPRAVLAGISAEEFDRVYRGEGRNAAETPLPTIVARSRSLALFVATVGSGVTASIRGLFERNQPAVAAMLDSVASAAADRLAGLLAPRFLALAGGDPAVERALPYSPGYCGWHVSGQRALFAALDPGEIGVALNASHLMVPLKSVSGVLVSGPSAVHWFTPAFAFCPDCREKPCRVRMAAVSRP